jgi:hypothetical protein
LTRSRLPAPARFILEIDIGEFLPGAVDHEKGGFQLFDSFPLVLFPN